MSDMVDNVAENITTIDINKLYPIEIKPVNSLIGITIDHIPPGSTGKVKTKDFLTSYDSKECQAMENIIQSVGINFNSINNILIVIKNNQAFIYRQFPMGCEIRAKKDFQKTSVVRWEDILDITAVFFKDAVFDLDVKNGDKFIWLFRHKFHFGLYFDFSGQLKISSLFKELGVCYRKLLFFETYKFLDSQPCFDNLLTRGWFPFAQLIGETFNQLMTANDSNIAIVEDMIIRKFTRVKIEDMIQYWWNNKLFLNKKKILMAGINAYFSDNQEEGIINCIKTLVTEIEGIIGLDFYAIHQRKASTEEIKHHIFTKGASRFSSEGTLCFPGQFLDFLGKTIFKKFKMESDSAQFSRHPVAHGYATTEEYSKIRALQIILAIDQMHFYLG